MIFGLTKKALGLDVVFTVVEIVTMVLWLALALKGAAVAAVVVLSVGLLIEHTISLIAGKTAAPAK